MKEVFIPTLHTFAMNNTFMLRYLMTPTVEMRTPKEVDMENSSITAQFWHGIYCYEKSEVEETKTFPMSEEGRQEMKAWLEANI